MRFSNGKKKTTGLLFFSRIIISEKSYVQANDDQRTLMPGTGDYAPVFPLSPELESNY